MSATNIFTQRPVPSAFGALKYDRTLMLEANNLPYFATLCFVEGRPVNPVTGKFNDEFAPIRSDGWTAVNDGKEFQFLESIGLGLRQGDEYFVSPYAYLLYDPAEGLFNRFNPTASAAAKKLVLEPFMRLMQSYVLPGRWWKGFYDTRRLPETIGEVHILTREMREIDAEAQKIASDYGLPLPR